MRFLLENVRIEIGEKKQDAYSPNPNLPTTPPPPFFLFVFEAVHIARLYRQAGPQN